MADTRNVVTAASLVAALLAGGWAIYATKHAGAPIEAPRAGVGARPGGAAPVVVSAVVRSERVSHELKALGTAIANESIEVMSKTSNFVSAVRFRDGVFEEMEIAFEHAEPLKRQRLRLQGEQTERHALAVFGRQRGDAHVDRMPGLARLVRESPVLRGTFFGNVHPRQDLKPTDKARV